MGTKNKEEPNPPTVPKISASKANKINKGRFSKAMRFLGSNLFY